MKTILPIMLLMLIALTACNVADEDTKLAKSLIEYQKSKYKDFPATGELKDGVREINLKAHQYFWEPELVIVNKGEKIKLNITSLDSPHGFEIEGFMIPDYDIESKIEKGQSITLEFTAEETGVWELICSVYCGAGHGDMKGLFVVR